MATVGDENDPTIGDRDMSVPAVAERPAVDEALQWSLLKPPPEGFTADDLDRIPNLPPHSELIDGSLVLVSPRKLFHMLMLRLLEKGLEAPAPTHLRVAREFSVRLGKRQRPEPDIMVVHADVFDSLEQTWVPPEAVELAVEVVSPESEIRDRERKPQLYARAGIPYYWRIEQEGDDAVLFSYEKDLGSPSGDYCQPTVHRKKLALSQPFDIELDLTDILNR
jgi:Uma2 family endonuclease